MFFKGFYCDPENLAFKKTKDMFASPFCQLALILYTKGFRNLFLMIFFLAPFLAVCQPGYKISGKVINEKAEAMMGNVVLLSAQDSTIITGESFLEGTFEIKGLEQKDFLLKLTSLQFADTIMPFKNTDRTNFDLGSIVVRNLINSLQEVVVESSTPIVSNNSNGNIEVNVANTVLSTSTSVVEILSRSPNIITNDDGISVFGKGEAIIYLNGRRITFDQLSSISASQVKKIEIISNPSAKYDAEGKAVVNIITKGRIEEGYNGAVSQTFTSSVLAGIYSNSAFKANYKKQKFDFRGNYELKLGKDKDLFNTTRSRKPEDEFISSTVRSSRERNFKNVSNYTFGATYNINDRSYISGDYNGFTEKVNALSNSKNTIFTDSEKGDYSTKVKRRDGSRNNSINVNINHSFDSLGSSLFVGAQYSDFTFDINDNISEVNTVNDPLSSRILKSELKSRIEIYSPQVDFVKFWNKNHNLEIGGKMSNINTDSDLNFYILNETQEATRDTSRSSGFKYQEIIIASYFTLNGRISDKVIYGVGLRNEWTNYDFNSATERKEGTDGEYVNFFPNAQVIADLNQFKFRLSYSSRITRPSFQSLNPFLIYQDAYTSIEGNPLLIPEKAHSIEIGGNVKNFDLKFNYQYTLDPLSAAATKGSDDKSYVLKGINLDRGYAFLTTLSSSINKNWWTCTNSGSISYTKMIDTVFAFGITASRPQIYLYSNNKFKVKNWFDIQLLAWYRGNQYDGISYRKNQSLITLGLEKDFFKKSMKVSLTANDIFHQNKPEGNYKVGPTNVTYFRKYNTSFYRLSLIWNFGELKDGNNKNRKLGVEENGRVR